MGFLPEDITLRTACEEDSEIFFVWRNSSFIVKQGSLQRTVTREEHERWFANVIVDPEYAVYVVMAKSTPVGQVRFQKRDSADCVVSAYLSQEWTAKGIGTYAIKEACRRVFSLWPVNRVFAEVRLDNAMGKKAFSTVGFEEYVAHDALVGHHTYVLSRGGAF